MRARQEKERWQRKVHSISIVNGVIVTERDEVRQWTPTKVAKPNSDGCYLVTVNDNVTVLRYSVAQGFVPELLGKYVTAWQQLPKAYRS